MTQHRATFATVKSSDRRSAPSSRGSWDARPEPSWRRSGPKAKVIEIGGVRITNLVAFGVFVVGFGLGAVIVQALGLI